MLVFATNVGSSATVVGNPIGVFIAFEGGLTFMDFLRWATPVAVVVMLIVVPLSILYFSKDIKKLDEFMKGGKMELSIEIPRRDLVIAFIVFFGTISFLVAHHTIEEIFHLAKNTMLLGTAIGAAGVSLLIDQERAREIVERKVDWWTLLFFLLFFASVGTLVYMNVTDRLASGLILLTGGNELFVLGIFGGVSGITTAFMDNVLAVATLSPVVHSLGEVGFFTFPFWWALLFGGTYFGNLTMIGSTANIVAIGMLERRKLGHITFSQWIKPGIIVSVPSLIVALFILYIQIPLMG
jgi:Na+/H+ antiporter NhaD/arsenite permease-like protein